MKKFLKTISLFVLLFFGVDKLFYWKIQSLPERELDKRLEWVLEGKMNKEILIFGSSRAQHDLYADLIQDSLKMSCFNLGYRGANIDFQLFLLKSVLKHNKKPKIVFLTLDDDSEFTPEKTLQFRYDKLYPLVRYPEIVEELVERNEMSPFAFPFLSARLGREQFVKPKLSDKFSRWTPAGTVLLEGTITGFNKEIVQSKKYNSGIELSERLNAFKEFQQICLNNNIQLVAVIPPNRNKQNVEFVKRVQRLIISKKIKLYYKSPFEHLGSFYFYDISHLNSQGAVKYTNDLIKQNSMLLKKSHN